MAAVVLTSWSRLGSNYIRHLKHTLLASPRHTVYFHQQHLLPKRCQFRFSPNLPHLHMHLSLLSRHHHA